METYSSSEEDEIARNSLESDVQTTNESSNWDSAISAIQGNTDGTSDWQDLGIVDVDVRDLPNPENVNGPEDFDHHISYEDAKNACEKLPNIQQKVKEGYSADDFSTEDQKAGLSYSEGQRSVYDLFYSESDPVRLDKDGNNYDIVSGRHRIYAAKEAGLNTIPARVIEKRKKDE